MEVVPENKNKAVTLRIVEPYIEWAYPNRKSVNELIRKPG